MHLTSILTIAALALIKQVTATICTGTSTFTSGNLKGTSYDVAWIDGEDACRWTFIANANDNPCGREFTLPNGYTILEVVVMPLLHCITGMAVITILRCIILIMRYVVVKTADAMERGVLIVVCDTEG